MVVAPECMVVGPGKNAGTGGTQCVGPIRGTRNWCLNMIGGAMSQQSPGNFPGKLPGDFLRTPSARSSSDRRTPVDLWVFDRKVR